MDRQMGEQTVHLAREKALYRYSSALERGDFEVVSQVLTEAERDPVLEGMILEINEALQAEEKERQVPVIPAVRSENAHRRGALTWLRKKLRSEEKGEKMAKSERQPRNRRWTLRQGLAVGGVVFGILLVFAIALSSYNAPGRRSDTASRAGDGANGTIGQELGLEEPPWDTRSSVAEDSGESFEYVQDADHDDSVVRTTGGALAPPVESSLVPVEAPPAPAADLAQSETVDRLIIRNGYITMVVEDTRITWQSIEDLVAGMAGEGAYIVSSNEEGGLDEDLPYISMSIRVPAARFDETMAHLADLAFRVTARHESGQDVTEEYVDLENRLESLETSRQRLLEIMQEAETAEVLLDAEQHLTEREAEIESIKGRMQYLSQSAQLSAIFIELQPYRLSQPVDAGWQPAETARDAWEALLDGLRGLADFAIYFAIAILPWLVVLGVVVGLVMFFVRRRRRKRLTQHAANSQDPDGDV